jgi:hypothetical protein
MWLSEENPGDSFLFKDKKNAEADFEPENNRRKTRVDDHAAAAHSHKEVEKAYNATTDQLRMLLDQCLQVVRKDPEVALRGRPAEWEIWFQEPLLSSVRTSSLPLGLKLRLLAFLGVMLPFLDEREQDRVKGTLVTISAQEIPSYGDILTEQDLIHTQWLIRGVRRSKDIMGQMEALRRSILRRVPSGIATV